MSEAWLLVGLGNPGPDYAGTRHNVGAMALASWAQQHEAGFSLNRRARAEVATGRVGPPGGGIRVLGARLRCYMNESGWPVLSLLNYYDLPAERLIVIHDELDLPFGGLRLKFGGGDNGHNGLKSIRQSTGTGEFYRVRMGIGRPPGRQDPIDYVLRPFGTAEREPLAALCAEAADAVDTLVSLGLERAQGSFNR
ncbi:MAG: aminoacyl-tRNA hydrolase [Candidatus Nanopelagicales bacterium]